jgi:hypothetical protein
MLFATGGENEISQKGFTLFGLNFAPRVCGELRVSPSGSSPASADQPSGLTCAAIPTNEMFFIFRQMCLIIQAEQSSTHDP